ncbi:transposable element Tcb1 transposase [Trichonephila clavipes]|nr:transposable element Tcb1 transposase [Trichonephila clavipes]
MNCLIVYQTLLFGQADPSPIEPVWDMMGMRLHLLGNVYDLVQQLEQIWQEIPQETIIVLHHSMLRRVATCIQAREIALDFSSFRGTVAHEIFRGSKSSYWCGREARYFLLLTRICAYMYVKWTALRATASPPLSIPLPGGCEGKQREMTPMEETEREKRFENARENAGNAKGTDAHWRSRSNS